MSEINLGDSYDDSEDLHHDLNGDELSLFAWYNPAPVMRLSNDLEWVTGNPAAVNIFKKESISVSDIVAVFPFLLELPISELITQDKTFQIETVISNSVYNFSIRGLSEFNCINLYGSDISDRKRLEKKILHLKKMDSMGTISAGVAHELNTPIQFIGDNNDFLKDSIQQLLNHLEKLISLSKNVNSMEEFDQFKKQIEPEDFSYLKDELPDALNDSENGIKKISKIVKAMKAFTHPGDSTMHHANINEIIHNSITLANSEWKYCSEITLNLDETIPSIPCMADELGQVFLNLIINSAHAIKNFNQSFNRDMGEIIISTSSDDHNITIEFIDNGVGIPTHIIDRVFDPFFTTKEIGEGTGQGLSFVYGIITKSHKGTIHVESTPNEYTKFLITLRTK